MAFPVWWVFLGTLSREVVLLLGDAESQESPLSAAGQGRGTEPRQAGREHTGPKWSMAGLCAGANAVPSCCSPASTRMEAGTVIQLPKGQKALRPGSDLLVPSMEIGTRSKRAQEKTEPENLKNTRN